MTAHVESARRGSRSIESGATPETLIQVIDAIPEDCYTQPLWRGLVLVARDIVVYAATLVALAATNRWYLVLPLWVLAGFAVSGMFVLGHDAAHGALFAHRRLNGFVGRVLDAALAAHVRSMAAGP